MGSKFTTNQRVQPTPKVCKSKQKPKTPVAWPPSSFTGLILAEGETYEAITFDINKSVQLRQVAWDEYKWQAEWTITAGLAQLNFFGADPREYFRIEFYILRYSEHLFAAVTGDLPYSGSPRYDTFNQQLIVTLGVGSAIVRVME